MVNVYEVHSLFVLLLIILAVLSYEESSLINSDEPWIIELGLTYTDSLPREGILLGNLVFVMCCWFLSLLRGHYPFFIHPRSSRLKLLLSIDNHKVFMMFQRLCRTKCSLLRSGPWTTRLRWCHLGPSTLKICYPSDWFWWGIDFMDVRILRIDEWLMFSSPWLHICMWNYIVYLNSSERRMILCHVVHQNRSLAHHGSSKLDFDIDALMWRPTCTSEINGSRCLAVIQILSMDRIAS